MSYDEVGILINETAGAISVTYSASIFVAQDGARRRGESGAVFAPPSMRGVVFDKAACTARFEIGPSQAA